MIFNPLIVVASELGVGRSAAKSKSETNGEAPIVRAYRRVGQPCRSVHAQSQVIAPRYRGR